ncbi:lasso peptide biosynthesis B2 protein [Chitinasiproducens palmae]|uniref:Transglutaminase-like superfamily protein n=1 Tax=Chitinasiproducens palmae TaxID=1770053 RepID=A0A1H2PXF2_9BURK|nr:lasso peptide biosynthesis B2 protein [Chitinasiproducens palmae]SDV51655.1 Transglutaminase-like superfamily protein [Chitinasiproducens palmae]
MGNPVFRARFEDQLIVLDVAKDSYTVLSPEQTRALACKPPAAIATVDRGVDAAEGRWPRGERGSTMCDVPGPDDCDYGGVPSNCWSISSADVSVAAGVRLIGQALLMLHRAHRISATRRLAGLQKHIETDPCRARRGRVTQYQLATALNVASLLYPKRTKCLEWAAAAILLGHRFGYRSTLVIGVQNRPFYAHAWVEHAGHVVGDDPTLRRRLAVILEIA